MRTFSKASKRLKDIQTGKQEVVQTGKQKLVQTGKQEDIQPGKQKNKGHSDRQAGGQSG